MHSAPRQKAKVADKKTPAMPPQDERQKTRAEKIEESGGRPLMPDVGEVAYVVAYWQDAGMVATGGMAPARLSSTEVATWAAGCGVTLAPWEFRALRDMSSAYLAELMNGENPETPPPYGDPVQEFDREALGKRITGELKAFMMSKKSR